MDYYFTAQIHAKTLQMCQENSEITESPRKKQRRHQHGCTHTMTQLYVIHLFHVAQSHLCAYHLNLFFSHFHPSPLHLQPIPFSCTAHINCIFWIKSEAERWITSHKKCNKNSISFNFLLNWSCFLVFFLKTTSNLHNSMLSYAKTPPITQTNDNN